MIAVPSEGITLYRPVRHGETVGKFNSRDEAAAALNRLIEEDPLAADECAVIELDVRGNRVGQPISAVPA